MIALALALAITAPIRPDPALTPGVANPAATLAVICVRGYTAQASVRHVTEATKRAVFAEYHIPPSGEFEIDHLESLQLGGSNDIKNLWPQSYTTQPWNAHVKDGEENRLHALICAGRIPLGEAQHSISTDWIAAWRRDFGKDHP